MNPDGSSVFLSFEIPAPGFFVVELNHSEDDEFEPWLDISRDACSQRRSGPRNVYLIESSLKRHVVAITAAGTYPLRIGSLSGGLLSPFKVTTRFVYPTLENSRPSPPALKDGDDDNDPGETEEPNEEIFPLLFEDGDGAPTGGFPGGTWPVPVTEMAEFMENVFSHCQGEEAADDLTLCAHVLAPGLSAGSDLAADRLEDHDYYTFLLKHAGRVRVSTSGDTDTIGVLFDDRGRRLVATDGGGEDGNFSFDAELPPGRYLVRVEGAWGATGPYVLAIDDIR